MKSKICDGDNCAKVVSREIIMCKYSENRYMCVARLLTRTTEDMIVVNDNDDKAIDLDMCISDDVTLYKCDDCYALSMERRRSKPVKMRTYGYY